MAKGSLVCPLLICTHWSSAGLCHTFCLYKARKILPTIHFQMTLLTRIKILNILIFLKNLEITSVRVSIISLRSNVGRISNPFIFWSWSCLTTLSHSELAFSKANDSINICLTSESGAILFTAEANLCKKKKSVKSSFRPWIILANDSDFFPESSSCPKHSKLPNDTGPRCDHQIQAVFISQHIGLHQELDFEISVPLAIFHCSVALVPLSTVFFVVTGTNIAVAKSSSLGDNCILSCPGI